MGGGRLHDLHRRAARDRRPPGGPVRPPPGVRGGDGDLRRHLSGVRAGARSGRAGRGPGGPGGRGGADGAQHPVHPRRGLHRAGPGPGDQRLRDGDGAGRHLGPDHRRDPHPRRRGRAGLADDLLDQRAHRRGRAAGRSAPGPGIPRPARVPAGPDRGDPDHRLPDRRGAAAGRGAAGGLAGLVLGGARRGRPARRRVRRPSAAQGRPRRCAAAQPAGLRLLAAARRA